METQFFKEFNLDLLKGSIITQKIFNILGEKSKPKSISQIIFKLKEIQKN
jgi:hypothetical protein